MAKAKLMAVATAGVVAMATAGGTYALTRYYAGGYGPAHCGRTECIPNLKAADVVNALRAKGHTCTPERENDTKCGLLIGDTEYEATLHTAAEGITDMYISVYSQDRNRNISQSPTAMAYFRWFIELPFADDPSIATDIHKWLTTKIHDRKESTGTIAGYRYRMDATRSAGYATLSIDMLGS